MNSSVPSDDALSMFDQLLGTCPKGNMLCLILSPASSAKVCIIRLFAVGGICIPCWLFFALCTWIPDGKRHMSRAYAMYVISLGHLRMAQVASVYRQGTTSLSLSIYIRYKHATLLPSLHARPVAASLACIQQCCQHDARLALSVGAIAFKALLAVPERIITHRVGCRSQAGPFFFERASSTVTVTWWERHVTSRG